MLAMLPLRAGVDVWSQDGQEVYLEFGFYYKLERALLADLYYEYKENWLPVVEDTAANTVRDVATNFTTIDFFTSREEIDDAMFVELRRRVSACCFANVTVFNLLGIDVPDGFDRAVLDKTIAKQKKLTLSVQKDAAIIRQSVAVINAQADQNITRANVNAERDAIVTRASADANATVTIGTAYSTALKEAATVLEMNQTASDATDGDAVIRFAFADIVRSVFTANTSLFVDIGKLLVAA